MKREFIACAADLSPSQRETQPNASTMAEACRLVPWARCIIRVEGGWLAFESLADYGDWRRQN